MALLISWFFPFTLPGYGYPHPGAFNPFMLNPAWLDAAYMTYGYADYFRHQAAAQAQAQVHHPALVKAAAASASVSPNSNPNPAATQSSPVGGGGASSSASNLTPEYAHAQAAAAAAAAAAASAGQPAAMPSPPGAAPAAAYAMPQFPFNHVAKATPHAFHPYNFAAAAGLRARNAALHPHSLQTTEAAQPSPASSRPSSSSPTQSHQSHVLLKLNTSIETSSIHEQSASDADSDDEQIDVVKSEYDLDKSIDSTRSSPAHHIAPITPIRMRCDLKAPSAMKPLYHETSATEVPSPETTCIPAATKLKSAAVQQKTVWRPY